MGQHNEYVFKQILGMSDDEIANLMAEGVITTDADLPAGGYTVAEKVNSSWSS